MAPKDLTFKVLHVRASGRDMAWPSRDKPPVEFDMGFHRRTKTRTGGSNYRMPVKVEGLRELLEWAFGPKGPPNLRVVAYGDFSYNGRYAEHSFMFCKRELRTPKNTKSVLGLERSRIFRVVEKKDVLWDDVITPVKHLLAACPVDPLMSQLWLDCIVVIQHLFDVEDPGSHDWKGVILRLSSDYKVYHHYTLKLVSLERSGHVDSSEQKSGFSKGLFSCVLFR